MVTYFYQEKADPSRYLGSVGNLAWMQTVSAVIEPQLRVNYSVQVNVNGYLTTAVDLSWLQSNSGVVIRPVVIVYDTRADVSWFAVAVVSTPDLSWIQVELYQQPVVPTYQSLRTSIVGFLSPPLDVSWLSTSQHSVQQLSVIHSIQADVSEYLSP